MSTSRQGTLPGKSRHLTAFEHQSLWIDEGPPDATITKTEAERLLEIGETRPGFCERRFRAVKLAQYCGVVSLGHRMLEILPKVEERQPEESGRGILLSLLRQSHAFPLFRHRTAAHHLRHAPLLEVFITSFFDEVTAIVRGGLLRHYQELADDLPFVRGRIVTSRQFAVLADRTDRVACRFDELSTDSVWNQFLKAALWALRPWIATVDVHRRWVELMAIFDEVSDVQMEADALRRFPFDRHAIRYRTATDWARWILSLLSPGLRAGKSSAAGLLFDMNLLFQSAVANAFRRHYGDEHVHIGTQDSGTYLGTLIQDKRKAFALRPDIVLRDRGQVVAIADTKWKKWNGGSSGDDGPSPGDIYQMNAYASAYNCSRLLLVYPWHSGLRRDASASYEISTTGLTAPTLCIGAVDVSRSPLSLQLFTTIVTRDQ